MSRIDRKIKRQLQRAHSARSIKEGQIFNNAFDQGVKTGIAYEKTRMQCSTMNMGYLYEYSVEGTPEQPAVADSSRGASLVRVTDIGDGIEYVEQLPAHLADYYPDAKPIPA